MHEILRKFDISSLYICPPYLYTVTTLPWEIKKEVIFNSRLQIITLSQKKQTVTVWKNKKGGRFLGHNVVILCCASCSVSCRIE